MKPSDSPVHDCIKENHETLAKEDVDFQEMDYTCSDDGDFENEDEKHLLDLVPSVLETMNNHGKVDIYMDTISQNVGSCLISDGQYSFFF
jgi:hypothetical protein